MSFFGDTWSRSSVLKRVLIIFSIAVLLVSTVIAVMITLDVKQEVLFQNLEQQSAANITSGLDHLKIDYQLADGGSTILVDQDLVHKTRLQLVNSGVQLGGVGFELFDETEFGMTEFVQKINFQRALQGELSRTINAIEAVKFSRVHLVIPKKGLFDQKEKATASVILFLNGTARLSNQQIEGVQNLVASSVPELDADRVTVLDDRGITLSNGLKEGDVFTSAGGRLEKKRELESYLKSKIVNLLDTNLGSGIAEVSVDVDINFDAVNSTYERILPTSEANNIIRKRESRSEGEGKKDRKSRVLDSEIEYAFSKQVEQVNKVPGEVRRISIGVSINRDLDSNVIEKLTLLISNAVGLDTSRGDQISIHALQLGGVKQAVQTTEDVKEEEQLTLEPIDLDSIGIGKTDVDKASTTNGYEGHQFSARLHEIFQLARNHIGEVLLIMVLLVLLTLISTIRSFTFRRKNNSVSLTSMNREETLMLLQNWLENDNDQLQKESK